MRNLCCMRHFPTLGVLYPLNLGLYAQLLDLDSGCMFNGCEYKYGMCNYKLTKNEADSNSINHHNF